MIQAKNRHIIRTLIIVFVGFMFSFTIIGMDKKTVIHENYLVDTPQLVTVSSDVTEIEIFPPQTGKAYIGFKEALAYRESRGNYFAVNPYGYIGKYQFGKLALKHYGVDDVESFLNSPEQQEQLFRISLQCNKWNLRREIKKYAGKKINGVTITESGILAAAHLAGVHSVKEYFKCAGNYFFADANGITLQNYMNYFEGYDLEEIVAQREATFQPVS